MSKGVGLALVRAQFKGWPQGWGHIGKKWGHIFKGWALAQPLRSVGGMVLVVLLPTAWGHTSPIRPPGQGLATGAAGAVVVVLAPMA